MRFINTLEYKKIASSLPVTIKKYLSHTTYNRITEGAIIAQINASSVTIRYLRYASAILSLSENKTGFVSSFDGLIV